MTDLETSASVLHESELYRLLVKNVQDYAIFMIDPEGRVESWNPGAERLFGFGEEEVIGRSTAIFFTPEDIERGYPQREMDEALEYGTGNDDRWHVRKDGSRFWCGGTMTPLWDDGGKLRGFAKIMRDRTEWKRHQDATEEQVRLAAFIKDVSVALAQSDSLPEMLQRCAEALVGHLHGAFARIWTLNSSEGILELQASAGLYTHLDGPHGRIPVGKHKVGRIAEERTPHVTNSIATDPRVSDPAWAQRKGMVAFAGYPLLIDARLAGVMAVFARHPLSEATLDAIASVANGIAVGIERKVGEEETKRAAALLRDQEQRTRTILESITDAFFALGRDWRFTYVNRQAEVMLERTRDDLLGKNIWEEFAPAVGTDFDRNYHKALAENVAVTFEAFYPPHDRWYEVHAYPSPDGLSIYFRDVGERKRAEITLLEQERRFRQLADAMPQIVWTARADGEIDYLNRQWTKLSGLPETVGNAGWGSVLHPDESKAAGDRWAASLGSGDPFEMELRLLDRRLNAYRWHLIRTVAIPNEAGAIVHWFGTATDIHEQKRAEESSRYLAEASAALAGLVDYESTLQKVANLAVPYFADWSAVDVANDDGSLRRLAVAHQDAVKIRMVHELMAEYPPDPQAPGGAFAVLRTGTPEIFEEITDAMLVQGAKDDRHLGLIRSLGLRSYICVPLLVSGHPLGVLTFATAESGRTYTNSDLALAVDLARRAGIAIENTRLYQALRDADRRKDEFLATLAHELRNPLAPIRNALQILKMPRVDAATVGRSRDMMERQLQHLVRLVDDLLDVSRVMQGKIELRREKVEIATVVARAVETVQPLVEAQGHDLSVAIPAESLLLDADPVRLAQIVSNLLTNAAKYTERGGRIGLTAKREGNEVVLRVRDNGIGITASMLPRIFELFVQVDHASTKAQGGLGIGLTLVKNLVQMHNGSVEARSAGLSQGSEFVVRLPLTPTPAENEAEPESPLTADPPRPTGHRLLVVDDNRDAADSLAMLLELQGHEVYVAHSGPAALEMTKGYSPDAVFLDIGMPGMDGYEVARRLRQLPGLENVVLAALTGWGQQEDRRRTAEAGFNHHLVKPPEPKEVVGVLDQLKRWDRKS